jgi:two-component system aerobic respiration control sensor histidine kinase ArcB
MTSALPTSADLTRALPDRFDSTRFLRLIDIAGPSLARTLLAQLVEDLGTCQRHLTAARDRADWPGMRQASHDLISLAGSCGAETLHDLARAVNAAAHAQSLAPIIAQAAQIDDELAALIAVIRSAEQGKRQW